MLDLSTKRHGRVWATAVLVTLMTVMGSAQIYALEPVQGYVVVLDPAVADPDSVAAEHELSYGVDVGFIYRHALKGYAAQMTAEAAMLVAADVRVESVGDDSPIDLAAQTIPTGIDRVYEPGANNSTMPNLTVNARDDKRVDADIAIIDTGVDHTHPDLNVVGGADCTRATTAGECIDGFAVDSHSHGTHVAGTAAALDNDFGVVGVAPGARIWTVKALGSNGSSLSSLMASIDWVTARSTTIEVANISLGCRFGCPEVNLALANSVAKGVTYAVAAGNSSRDASTDFPANSPDVITVSAVADGDGRSGGTDVFYCSPDFEYYRDDTRARFSNFGPPIDVAAPGACINSTVPGGGYSRFSGTSMASPHAVGAAALLASQDTYRGDPALIKETILATGNFGWTDTSGDGVQEPLLEVTSFVPSTISLINEPPAAGFTTTCSTGACTFTSTSTDSDGTITSWTWTFHDGTGATGPTASYTYVAAGKYKVSLTVTDDDRASSTASQTVTCRKVKGSLVCK